MLEGSCRAGVRRESNVSACFLECIYEKKRIRLGSEASKCPRRRLRCFPTGRCMYINAFPIGGQRVIFISPQFPFNLHISEASLVVFSQATRPSPMQYSGSQPGFIHMYNQGDDFTYPQMLERRAEPPHCGKQKYHVQEVLYSKYIDDCCEKLLSDDNS
jgi:hypothetical protein